MLQRVGPVTLQSLFLSSNHSTWELKTYLVGGFSPTPSEKYAGFIKLDHETPKNQGENKHIYETTTVIQDMAFVIHMFIQIETYCCNKHLVVWSIVGVEL